jgi:hypothetical protein
MNITREDALDWALSVADKQLEQAPKDTPQHQILTQYRARLQEMFDEIEINCSHCNDTQEYEGDTCPYCKPNKEREDGERAMDFNKGN